MKKGINSCLKPKVFIHRSIKTRIETMFFIPFIPVTVVFIHRSIKTRIETNDKENMLVIPDTVFIHRSIKTRIET